MSDFELYLSEVVRSSGERVMKCNRAPANEEEWFSFFTAVALQDPRAWNSYVSDYYDSLKNGGSSSWCSIHGMAGDGNEVSAWLMDQWKYYIGRFLEKAS